MTEPGLDIVLRHTGEIIDPDDPVACLAAYKSVEALQAQVAEAKRALAAALSRYSVDRGERTVVLPDVGSFTREGGPRTEYPNPRGVEKDLLDAGCPPDRVKEVVETKMTVEKRVNGTEANKLKRNNPVYAEILDRHARKTGDAYRIGKVT